MTTNDIQLGYKSSNFLKNPPCLNIDLQNRLYRKLIIHDITLGVQKG